MIFLKSLKAFRPKIVGSSNETQLLYISLSHAYISKAGESQGQAPGQASDYALRAPTLLTVAPMTRRGFLLAEVQLTEESPDVSELIECQRLV